LYKATVSDLAHDSARKQPRDKNHRPPYQRHHAIGCALAPGGSGLDGATQILLRAAVAAYLNSLTLDGYAYSTSLVASMVNSVLASGDRSIILGVAAALDAANNAGTCPLD
jgi:hypothetical protein